MDKKTATLVAGFLLSFSLPALAASTSTSYKLVTEAVSVGAEKSTSASYAVYSIAGHRQLNVSTSTSFSIGEGFLRSTYYTAVIFKPLVTGITPSSANNNETKVIITDLAGANFVSGASVKLSKSGQSDITATDVVVASSSKITCILNINGAAAGLWDVTVTNSDGRSGTLPSAFKVEYASPKISSVSPEKAVNTETAVNLTLTGEYFRSGATIKLSKLGETDILADNVVVESSTRITCRINPNGKSTGQWDIVITNDDSKTGTLTSGFKIEAPELTIVGPIEVTKSVTNVGNNNIQATVIKYNMTKDADVIINIYNMRGEKIWTYTAVSGGDGGKVGINQITWDGMTAFKSIASAGVYIMHITAKQPDGSWTTIGKMKIGVVK